MDLVLVVLQLSRRGELSVTEPAAVLVCGSASSQLRVLQRVLHQPVHVTCTHTNTHACTGEVWRSAASSSCWGRGGGSPEVALRLVGADLADEGRRLRPRRPALAQTQVALEGPVVELLHAHHHAGGLSARRGGGARTGDGGGGGARGCGDRRQQHVSRRRTGPCSEPAQSGPSPVRTKVLKALYSDGAFTPNARRQSPTVQTRSEAD